MEILRMKHKARDLNTERSEEPHEGLSIRLDTAEERFPELEYTSPNWKESQKEKPKQSPECPRMLDNYKRCNMCIMGIPKGEEKEAKRSIWNSDRLFSKFNVRHQAINAGSSENTKWCKYKDRQTTRQHIIFKQQKIKDRENNLERSQRRKNSLSVEEQKQALHLAPPQKPHSETRVGEIVEASREQNHQPRILYPVKFSFEGKGE